MAITKFKYAFLFFYQYKRQSSGPPVEFFIPLPKPVPELMNVQYPSRHTVDSFSNDNQLLVHLCLVLKTVLYSIARLSSNTNQPHYIFSTVLYEREGERHLLTKVKRCNVKLGAGYFEIYVPSSSTDFCSPVTALWSNQYQRRAFMDGLCTLVLYARLQLTIIERKPTTGPTHIIFKLLKKEKRLSIGRSNSGELFSPPNHNKRIGSARPYSL